MYTLSRDVLHTFGRLEFEIWLMDVFRLGAHNSIFQLTFELRNTHFYFLFLPLFLFFFFFNRECFRLRVFFFQDLVSSLFIPRLSIYFPLCVLSSLVPAPCRPFFFLPLSPVILMSQGSTSKCLWLTRNDLNDILCKFVPYFPWGSPLFPFSFIFFHGSFSYFMHLYLFFFYNLILLFLFCRWFL